MRRKPFAAPDITEHARQDYPDLPMTDFITKTFQSQGMQPGDVQKLYQLGMLKYLPLSTSILMDTQAELVRFFPSNPPPSRILSGVYRLALSLVNNDYRRLDTFLAQRAYYTPIRQEIHLSGIDWNEEYQCSSPLDKCFNPNLFHPDPEPRPRLIDRMQLITEDAAREYLDILSRDLSDVRFATIFGRYFEELTLSEIGARRGCKIENIRSRRYVAIQQLRYRHPPSAQLRIDIFGADTIGKICNEQD